jgi:hypothetical protein
VITQSAVQAILTLNVTTGGASEIMGFTFLSSQTSPGSSGNNGIVRVSGCTISAATPNASFRIHHNTFTANNTAHIIIGCNGRGLVDNNTFNDTGSSNNESPVVNAGASWLNDVITPGTIDLIYFEDNTFNGGGTGNKTFTCCDSRIAHRFNIFINKTIDVHGNGPNDKGRWWESYKNQFTRTAGTNLPSTMIFRGGSGVVFGNTATDGGGSGVMNIQMYQDDDACGTYPATHQVGRGENNSAKPTYMFLNASSVFSFNLNDECPGLIQQDRDFYTDRSGSTGVRSGTRTTMNGTNCTTGQAFWVTDEGGNWDTLHGGSNDGKLYKCTATNTWTLYYTPLIYPHPLQSGTTGTVDSTPPAIPTNVQLF